MHMKNSDLTGCSGSVAYILPRQICDLTMKQGCKFGSLRNLNYIALESATKPYINR